uniref:Uncharacterized protein n=1 Tax=Panagrolaimus sp. JU765 TaxID=591449 RepID=A0AC34PUY1_9BILA
MSDSIDIKPVFESIRVKQEPRDYDEPKPKKLDIHDMVRRRKAIKRKAGKRKRRKKRRKKRQNKSVRKIVSAIKAAKKALIYNLGFDPHKEKVADFNPVIPEDPDLPDTEEKEPSTSIPNRSNNTAPAAEDLLDIILGQQEQLFSENFKNKKKPLTAEELKEKEERRLKRLQRLEENKKKELELKKMKEKQAREMEQEKRRQEQSPVKRKSRFSDDLPSAVTSNPSSSNAILPMFPSTSVSPPQMPLPLPNPSLPFNPAALAFLQQNTIDFQQAMLQQQLNLELLALQANPLMNQVLQQQLNPFLAIQPQLPVMAPSAPNLGFVYPPPPQDDIQYQMANAAALNYMTVPAPPPPPETGATNTPVEEAKVDKKAHLEKVVAVVKPMADKYGKRYKLSSDDYKKMCKKLVKQIAKYNTIPKTSKVESLVKEYATYLHNKHHRHKS